jgi:hypothetical protein
MGDEGIVVISLHGHQPEAWERVVRENPRANVLEVRVGDAAPAAESLESLSRLAETNGLALRMRR